MFLIWRSSLIIVSNNLHNRLLRAIALYLEGSLRLPLLFLGIGTIVDDRSPDGGIPWVSMQVNKKEKYTFHISMATNQNRPSNNFCSKMRFFLKLFNDTMLHHVLNMALQYRPYSLHLGMR